MLLSHFHRQENKKLLVVVKKVCLKMDVTEVISRIPVPENRIKVISYFNSHSESNCLLQ